MYFLTKSGFSVLSITSVLPNYEGKKIVESQETEMMNGYKGKLEKHKRNNSFMVLNQALLLVAAVQKS